MICLKIIIWAPDSRVALSKSKQNYVHPIHILIYEVYLKINSYSGSQYHLLTCGSKGYIISCSYSGPQYHLFTSRSKGHIISCSTSHLLWQSCLACACFFSVSSTWKISVRKLHGKLSPSPTFFLRHLPQYIFTWASFKHILSFSALSGSVQLQQWRFNKIF